MICHYSHSLPPPFIVGTPPLFKKGGWLLGQIFWKRGVEAIYNLTNLTRVAIWQQIKKIKNLSIFWAALSFDLKFSEKILLTKWVHLSHIWQGVVNNFKKYFEKISKNFYFIFEFYASRAFVWYIEHRGCKVLS